MAALRSLYFVARALIWWLAITAVSVPLAVAKYRRGGPASRSEIMRSP